EIAALSADSDPPQLDVLVELHGSIPDARNTTLRDGVREIRRIIQEIDEAYGACRAATAIKEIAGFVAEAGDRLVARKRGERVVTFDDLLTLARRAAGGRVPGYRPGTGRRRAPAHRGRRARARTVHRRRRETIDLSLSR